MPHTHVHTRARPRENPNHVRCMRRTPRLRELPVQLRTATRLAKAWPDHAARGRRTSGTAVDVMHNRNVRTLVAFGLTVKLPTSTRKWRRWRHSCVAAVYWTVSYLIANIWIAFGCSLQSSIQPGGFAWRSWPRERVVHSPRFGSGRRTSSSDRGKEIQRRKVCSGEVDVMLASGKEESNYQGSGVYTITPDPDPTILYVNVCREFLLTGAQIVQPLGDASEDVSTRVSKERFRALLPYLRRALACCSCGHLVDEPVAVAPCGHGCCRLCDDKRTVSESVYRCSWCKVEDVSGRRARVVGAVELGLLAGCYRQMCQIALAKPHSQPVAAGKNGSNSPDLVSDLVAEGLACDQGSVNTVVDMSRLPHDEPPAGLLNKVQLQAAPSNHTPHPHEDLENVGSQPVSLASSQRASRARQRLSLRYPGSGTNSHHRRVLSEQPIDGRDNPKDSEKRFVKALQRGLGLPDNQHDNSEKHNHDDGLNPDSIPIVVDDMPSVSLPVVFSPGTRLQQVDDSPEGTRHLTNGLEGSENVSSLRKRRRRSSLTPQSEARSRCAVSRQRDSHGRFSSRAEKFSPAGNAADRVAVQKRRRTSTEVTSSRQRRRERLSSAHCRERSESESSRLTPYRLRQRGIGAAGDQSSDLLPGKRFVQDTAESSDEDGKMFSASSSDSASDAWSFMSDHYQDSNTCHRLSQWFVCGRKVTHELIVSVFSCPNTSSTPSTLLPWIIFWLSRFSHTLNLGHQQEAILISHSFTQSICRNVAKSFTSSLTVTE